MPKISEKKVFDSLITGEETFVHLYEPKQKVDNMIWALKNTKRPSIGKQTLAAKKVLYAIFIRKSGPIMQIAVLKGRGVSSNFYKNVVLEKLRTKVRKIRPKTGLKHVLLLHDDALAHKSSAVVQCSLSLQRSMYCSTLPTAQTWSRAMLSSFPN